MDIQKFFG